MSKKILIVEDNPQNMKVIMMALRPHGYSLLEATDGEEALEIATREKPDFILMDIQLPEMSGIEAMKRIKEKDERGNPIVALTAYAMKGDKEKLKQVFINLLNNAFDAIKENGSICVDTGFGETQDEMQISISDTGIGIAKKDISKIFEPFYTTKAPDKGTGLGLSVTFGIIEEHNGTIKVFSPPLSGNKKDGGTQFIVTLPSNLTSA